MQYCDCSKSPKALQQQNEAINLAGQKIVSRGKRNLFILIIPNLDCNVDLLDVFRSTEWSCQHAGKYTS